MSRPSSPPQGPFPATSGCSAGEPARQWPSRRRAGLHWLVILSAVVLVVGPVLYGEIPRELSRWYFAAGYEKYLAGELPGAIESLDRALAWDPHHAGWHLQRARWKSEIGDFQGSLADCHRALELAPQARSGYIQRAEIYHHLGEHQRAVQDWQTLLEKSSQQDDAADRALLLNGLAYARALGNFGLEQALTEIEQALAVAGPNAAMLDTRGYIHYRLGNLAAAQEDLEQAVQRIEAQLQQQRAALERDQHQLIDLREIQLNMKQLEHSVAVIRYHRALVYDQLQLPKLAEKDRRRVEQLGYEPDERLF